jgi:outer membrane protein assembly factor BamD (BamD/ComL family)
MIQFDRHRTESAARDSCDARLPPQAPSLLRWLTVCSAVVIACSAATGCQSTKSDSDGMFDMSSLLDTSRIRGPLERSYAGSDSVLERGRKYSPEGQQKLGTAIALYDKGDRDRAIKQFKSIAKKFKETSAGEEAQFRLGEAYFATGQYPKAQDAYDQLFVDYPSTRFVEPATRNLFTIARNWLEISVPESRSDIKQVSLTSGEVDTDGVEVSGTSKDPTLLVRVLPNFHDRSRPVFDTQGRALQALKSIWLNDPTGPLADDALMLTATYHMRRNNPVEADRYFAILREEYTDSPHLEEAFLLGSHVKLTSYQGAHYEGITLASAENLKQQSLHLFPTSEQRSQLKKDLDRIYLLQAERKFSLVEYWQAKGRPRAVAVACMGLISEFPDTRFATEARNILRGLDREALAGLPEIDEFLASIPQDEPAESSPPTDGNGLPVKSVSDKPARRSSLFGF